MSITAKVTLEATQTLSQLNSFSREGVHVGGNFANYSTSTSIHRLGRVVEDFSQEEFQDTFSSVDNTPVTIEEFYIEYQTLAIEQGFIVVLKLNGIISNTGWETIEPPLGDFFLYRDEATFSTNATQSTYTWNFPGTQTEALQLFREFSSDTGLVNADSFEQFAILSYKFHDTKVFPSVTDIQLSNYFHSFSTARATTLYENTQNGHYCQIRSYGTFNGLDLFTDEKITINNFLDTAGASLSGAIPNSINNAIVTVVTTNCTIESQGSMNNPGDPTIIRPDQPGAFEAEVTFKYNVVAQGNCEEYTPTSGDAATTGQEVRKILTVRGLTFDHRRNTHELGSFSTIPQLMEWTEPSAGNKTFGVINNAIHQAIYAVPYLYTQGVRWAKNLSEREHTNMFTTQADFRSYNVPEDGPVREFFIEDFSSLLSPDIYKDNYRGTTANCKIVLRMSGRQPNSGWESLHVQRKYLGLNRTDAVYSYNSRTATSVPDGVTEWYWYKNLSLQEYWHFFSTQNAGKSGTRGNRTGLNSLKTVYFSGKSVFNRHTHILQKDMGNFDEEYGQGYNVGPNLLDSNDVLPLGFEIDGTNITGATYIPYDPEPMNSTFNNLGPTIRSTENCRVYGCVESPVEINYTDTGAYFKVNEHIIGASAPSTVAEEVEWSQKLTNRKILSKDGTFKGTIINANYATGLFSGIVADIDFNGQTDALTDGLLLLRYLFGLTGGTLIDNAVAEDAKRRTADQIQAYIEDPLVQEYLDFDNSGALDALTDGLLLLRYLFGLTSLSLTDNAIFTDEDGNPSATTEEVQQNLVTATNTFIVLGANLQPYTGDGDLASGDGSEGNQSTITFTADIDSTRSIPADADDLYIELRPGDELNNITTTTGIKGSSTFRMKEWELGQKVTKIGTQPNVPDTASLHMKYGAPMLLLTSINPGAYQASLDVHCDNNGSSFNDFKAKFTVQGMAGPTKTINIVNRIEDPDTSETVVESIDLSDTGDILKVNITDITDRSKVINYTDNQQEGWGTYHDEFSVDAVNCTVSGQDKDGESISNGGPFSAMVIPHAGGERYRASFTRQHRLFKKKTFIIEGTVRASTKEHQITYENPLSTTQFDQVSNIPKTVQGSNLKLVFKLNTDYQQTARRARVASLRGLYCTAEFLPDSSYGGHMVRSSGPLKLKEDTVTDIIFDSAVFQPTAPNFQCAVRLTINFPETQYDSAITRQYVGTWIGSYEGDYGLETVSAQGKTRMNTNTLPLKFVSSASGTLSIDHNGTNPGADVFESHQVINVEDLDNGFAGGLYSNILWNPATNNINTNPPQYAFIHSFAARERTVQSYYTVYYEGSKVINNHPGRRISPKRIGYAWDFGDPPNSNIIGGNSTNQGAILAEAETEDTLTQATYNVVPMPFIGITPNYQDDFNDYYMMIRRNHSIPINIATMTKNYYLPTNAPLFNNEDSYAIINNAPFSMVSGEQQVNNNRYKISITDWDHGPEYANFGSQYDVLTVNGNNPLRYSLQVLKIG